MCRKWSPSFPTNSSNWLKNICIIICNTCRINIYLIFNNRLQLHYIFSVYSHYICCKYPEIKICGAERYYWPWNGIIIPREDSEEIVFKYSCLFLAYNWLRSPVKTTSVVPLKVWLVIFLKKRSNF